MSKIRIEFKNQLQENINTHQDMSKMSKDIIDVIKRFLFLMFYNITFTN